MCRPRLVVLVLAAGLVAAVGAASALVRQMPAQPAEQHRMLLAGAGEWEGTLTSFTPGVQEAPVAARQVVEAIGPYWTQTRFECDFMGKPYVGTGVTGYDAAKGKFVGTWIDNSSPWFALMEGEVDEEAGGIVMRWEAPGRDGKMEKHRMVGVLEGDRHTSTFYMGEGQGTKSMVIELTRQPKDDGQRDAGR